NLGAVLRDLGRPGPAVDALRQALAIQRRLLLRLPTDADRFANTLPPSQDIYLSALRRGRPAPSAYRGMAGRALLSHVLALRQATARAAGGPPRTRDLVRRLTEANRELGWLLLGRSAPSPTNTARLQGLEAEIDRLRRELARSVPQLDAARLE